MVAERRSLGELLSPLLNNISITLQEKAITTLIGESGSGKTMFARTLVNLLPANIFITHGTVFFKQQPVLYPQLKKLRGKAIFYVPQDAVAALNPVVKLKHQLTQGSPEKMSLPRLVELLAQLNFPDPRAILDSYPFQLSGGESQRCLFAMAILQKPQLLILDEPTSALDIKSQASFIQLLKQLQSQYNLTILLITHNLALAATVSDYIYIMHRGEIIENGPPCSLFTNPIHPYTRQIAQLIPSFLKST